MTRQRWHEFRSLLAILAVIAVISTIAVSCGGGGGGSGDTNTGNLCDQCGETDGPCQPTIEFFESDLRPQPAFCDAQRQQTGDPCIVGLRCLRKLDSAQRRCYPYNFNDQSGQFAGLDILYRCDGDRPNPNTATPQPSRTPTPQTSTTTSPGGETQDVTVSVDTGTFVGIFTVGVRYPQARGSFTPPGGGNPQCESDVDIDSTTDSGSALNINFPPAGDIDDFFDVTCTFYLSGDTELNDDDLEVLAPAGIDAEVST